MSSLRGKKREKKPSKTWKSGFKRPPKAKKPQRQQQKNPKETNKKNPQTKPNKTKTIILKVKKKLKAGISNFKISTNVRAVETGLSGS